MLGISYYASNQWRVAAMHPPHLAAIIPWEGQNDRYRDSGYHGGILSQFQERWAKHQVVNMQYGRGDKARKNPNTGESVAGPVTLTDEELAKNRVDAFEELKRHPLDDRGTASAPPTSRQITVPLLTCANWGGQGIHPRGNFNGFLETASQAEMAGGARRLALGALLQRLRRRAAEALLRLLPERHRQRLGPPAAGAAQRPPSRREVRAAPREGVAARAHRSGRSSISTPGRGSLSRKPLTQPAGVEYDATGSGVTFSMPPLERETEITGPMAAKLFVSSSTKDADLFLIVRVFDPAGKELTFMGSTDPNTPIANGWLRASHRRLDPAKSLPHRPYHPHDRVEPLVPGEIYECEVEIVPTCIVVPAGWRVALTVRGKDYEYEGELAEFAKKFHYGTRGTGGMTHNDPDSRPPEIFGGKVTLHAGPGRESYLLVPIIPPKTT